ncbi:MAG TPA: phosphoenolpyruvate-utilizing N-terminal domain-containing protein, partial [Candidatus Dormibacteraeota bacterium]|nr:phosphoenolpyruvate-utilizing N-terminal domain-containing protein [Candidatus Dormibacteraeota bacterium]
MTERVLAGVPASPGTAFGAVRHLDAGGEIDATVLDEAARPAAADRALEALARSAHELEDLAAALRAEGRTEEADILDAGVMMAEDPVLVGAVENAVLTRGMPAVSAIRVEVEAIAEQLDMIGDPELAARAADVRSLARRASRLAGVDEVLGGRGADGDTILIASDLGPADVIELDGNVRGIALAVGGVTGHAAIVARGLGLPMVVGLGQDLLSLGDGELCIVDGDRSVVIASPDREHVDTVRQAMAAARESRARAMAGHALSTV